MIETQTGLFKLEGNDYVQAAFIGEQSAFNANMDVLDEFISLTEQGKANISTVHNVTLQADSWVGEEAPYIYNLSLEGVSQVSLQDVCLAHTADAAQREAWEAAGLYDGGQSAGNMVLCCYGRKPSVDVPVVVVVRGDVF